jgi:hypothetical protein
MVTEFDAGLHHHADGAGEGAPKPGGGKGLAMNFDGLDGCLRLGELQMVDRFHRAAGDRDLGADDVDRQVVARFGGRLRRSRQGARRAPDVTASAAPPARWRSPSRCRGGSW